MKKSSSQQNAPGPRSRRPSETASPKTGSWAFNLATESLFALGSNEAVWRVAYRRANGDLRFLPH